MDKTQINGREFLHNLNIDNEDKQTLCVVIGSLCTEVAKNTAIEIISIVNSKFKDDVEMSRIINAIADKETQPIIDSLYNDIK